MFYSIDIGGASQNRHGGLCCGIQHLYGFEDWEYKTLNKSISTFKREFRNQLRADQQRHGSICYEVVLTEHQSYKLHKMVQDLNFKEVTRFRNANSRNICVVYHHYCTLKTPQINYADKA